MAGQTIAVSQGGGCDVVVTPATLPRRRRRAAAGTLQVSAANRMPVDDTGERALDRAHTTRR